MAKATKLDAVNIVLSNIGQAPVVNLESGNPMVEMAQLILDEVSRTVQSEGWVFNTEYGYPFTPDPTTKEIEISDNVLSLDTEHLSTYDAQIRNGKLYDRGNHTYDWSDQINLNVVWEFDFVDLPEAFKNYITVRAANVFAGRSVGSSEAVRFGQAEELQARAGAVEYDTQQGDYSIFGPTNAHNRYNSYRPEFALYRYS
jgi:hypothetical protein